MRKKALITLLLVLLSLLVIPSGSRRHYHRVPAPQQRDSVLRCLVALDGLSRAAPAVRVNEWMLRKLAEDLRMEPSIRVAAKGEQAVDSLRQGRADLLVTFAADSLNRDGLLSSRPFGDSTVWVIRSSAVPGSRMRGLNDWLTRREASPLGRRLTADYLLGKGVSLTAISPYDRLVKQHAAAHGWDWRFLSAMIYHESRFTNEAASDQGAVGLMQIVTERVSVDSLLDPSVNIAVGTQYLSRLYRMFSPIAANSTENMKYALAAFNAGEGRILDCVRYARSRGVDPSYWDNVAAVLPEMPGFRGAETVAYVRDVMATWSEYRKIYLR